MPGEKMARGRCQSCGMPIESGDFCRHCTDETGALRGFEETFERFVAFAMRQDASLDRQTAESNIRSFMMTMPAWQAHLR